MIRFKKTWIALAAVGLLAGACSSGEDSAEQAAEDPKAAFTDAVETLKEYEGASVTLSVASTEEDIVALAEAEGGEAPPPDVISKILNSSLSISAKGTDPKDSQAQILFNLDGSDVFEMRVVDGSLYARAEVRELAKIFGADTSMLDQADAQASAAGFDFVGPAIEGEWVGIEGFNELAQQLSGAPPASAEQSQQAIDEFANILTSNASVTSEGEDEVGAHVVVSLNIRETAQEFLDAVESLGQLPPGAAPLPDMNELPDGNVSLDAWISDGRLVQLELDFLQFAELAGEEIPEGVDQMALRMAIAEFTDDVDVPEGANLIDPNLLMQGLFGGLGGLGGTTSGGAGGGGTIPELGIACSDLSGLRPTDIRAFLKGAGRPDLYKATQEACPELF